MFSDILQRFIQKRPIVIMVRILLENFLNADQLDHWFDTVRQTQYSIPIQVVEYSSTNEVFQN